MKLSAETHREIEEFFRRHTGDGGLKLPPIEIHDGWVANLITTANGISGITFGRHVFVRSGLVRRDAAGRATMRGWLLVHEVAHVLQYERSGYLRFFRTYLRGYWRALREGRRWDRAGRVAAYFAIAEEREAREAELAFAAERGYGRG
jgi:hypothetical protein